MEVQRNISLYFSKDWEIKKWQISPKTYERIPMEEITHLLGIHMALMR